MRVRYRRLINLPTDGQHPCSCCYQYSGPRKLSLEVKYEINNIMESVVDLDHADVDLDQQIRDDVGFGSC